MGLQRVQHSLATKPNQTNKLPEDVLLIGRILGLVKYVIALDTHFIMNIILHLSSVFCAGVPNSEFGHYYFEQLMLVRLS